MKEGSHMETNSNTGSVKFQKFLDAGLSFLVEGEWRGEGMICSFLFFKPWLKLQFYEILVEIRPFSPRIGIN
jgi:hypothetical protein